MKKDLKLPLTFELKEYSGQSVFYIRLRREALADWCLGLCLLQGRLIDILIVTEESGRGKTEISVLRTGDRGSRGHADLQHEMAQLKMTPTQLDYLISFFLKYYRDGVAQVDHVDLEVTATGTESEDAYITITVPEFLPPITPEELRRRIG